MVSDKCDILLIDPPGNTKGLHSGLGILTSMLQQRNCRSAVLDLRNVSLNSNRVGHTAVSYFLDFDVIDNWIRKTNPDSIGITVSSILSGEARDIIKFVKRNFPDIKVIAGGPHLTFDGPKFVKKTGVDIGVIGEGEFTIQEVYDYLKGDRELSEIKGIVYKSDGKVIENPRREFINDLDSLPYPNYDNFTSVMDNNRKIRYYPINTSRGCPYSCTFCCTHLLVGKKWRARSPENIIGEIKLAKEKYDIESLTILDDNFTEDIDRWEAFLDLLMKEDLDLEIDCLSGVRAKGLTKDIFSRMKSAGFFNVCFGVESVDEKVFNAINKGETLEDVKRAIKDAKDAGLEVMGFFVVGLPYSNYEADMKSVNFAKKAGIGTWWSFAIPLPNTGLWGWVKEHGRVIGDYTKASPMTIIEGKIPFDTEDYPKEKRLEAFHRALLAAGDPARLTYPHTGLRRYLRVCTICLKYDAMALIPYHKEILRNFKAFLLRRVRSVYRLFFGFRETKKTWAFE